jgi:hypothetical protein
MRTVVPVALAGALPLQVNRSGTVARRPGRAFLARLLFTAPLAR